MKGFLNKKYFIISALVLGLFVMPAEVFSSKESARSQAIVTAKTLIKKGISFDDRFNSGFLKKGDSAQLTSTFYRGNHYHLVVGGGLNAKDVDIKIYDEAFKLIEEKDDDKRITTLDFIPKRSGTYMIKIIMDDAKNGGAYWTFLRGYR